MSSVSNVKRDGKARGVIHVQGDGRGLAASAMFKVMGGIEGSQPCYVQGDGKG